MRRNLSWLPLVVLALCTGGTIALAQPERGMPIRPSEMGGGVMQNTATCSSCKKEVTWTGTGRLGSPSSCPHCKVKFDYVEGVDGKRTTPMGFKYTPDNASKYIGIGIGVFTVIVIVVVKLAMASNSRPKRSAKRSTKRRKPRRRDEDDD